MDRKASSVNTMFTNIQNLAQKGEGRYDADFLFFCIEKLNAQFGQSKRYIMCKLLESGLAAHPLYSGEVERLRSEFDAAGRSAMAK